MRLTILLVLILLFTVAWAGLAIVRDKAIQRHAQIQQALTLHWSQQSLHQSEVRRQELLGRMPEGADSVSMPASPELPAWVKPYVEVEVKEEEGFGYSLYKLGFGGYLSSVPTGWFHGGFGVMLMVLSLLSLVEARELWNGV